MRTRLSAGSRKRGNRKEPRGLVTRGLTIKVPRIRAVPNRGQHGKGAKRPAANPFRGGEARHRQGGRGPNQRVHTGGDVIAGRLCRGTIGWAT